MKVDIHPEVFEALQEKTKDVEKLINDILFIWSKDGFILRSDVAGMFVLDRVFRKNCNLGTGVYDEITKEFKGVAVTGRKESESLFIPDARLHDMIKENIVLLILKSPRTQGISLKDTSDVFITEYEDN